jgi:phosphoserine phosphatase
MLLPRYRLVAFDLDGTLVAHHEPIWKTLHESCGSDLTRRSAVLRAARAGELSYAEWFAADVDMLRNARVTRQDIMAVVAPLAPTPGARELVQDLQQAGARVVVISGGVGLVVDTVFPDVRFDAVHINRLSFDAAGLLAGGSPTAYDMAHKVDGLRELAEQFAVNMADTAFVGDGPNDVAIAGVAGLSIAWGDADPGLVAASDHHVRAVHLDALRPLLFDHRSRPPAK